MTDRLLTYLYVGFFNTLMSGVYKAPDFDC